MTDTLETFEILDRVQGRVQATVVASSYQDAVQQHCEPLGVPHWHFEAVRASWRDLDDEDWDDDE